jgi:hypothetical protein
MGVVRHWPLSAYLARASSAGQKTQRTTTTKHLLQMQAAEQRKRTEEERRRRQAGSGKREMDWQRAECRSCYAAAWWWAAAPQKRTQTKMWMQGRRAYQESHSHRWYGEE